VPSDPSFGVGSSIAVTLRCKLKMNVRVTANTESSGHRPPGVVFYLNMLKLLADVSTHILFMGDSRCQPLGKA